MALAHRLSGPMALALLLAACGFFPAPSQSPTDPQGTPSPAAPSVPTGTSAPTLEPTPEPTPGPDAVPVFLAGGQVTTNAPGLRVRSRPGVAQRVVTTLGVDTDLLVVLGPVLVDGFGWYLVQDADGVEPDFGEGWVAAGFEPDPFLISTSFEVPFNQYIASFAHDGDGEFGPVHIADANHGIRWVAAPLSPDGCRFAVDLVRGNREPVVTVRAVLGAAAAPGDVPASFFTNHPDLVGDLLVRVTSNCSWAITFVQFQG